MSSITEKPAAGNGALPWLPVLIAALCSYGPVGYNYGFALYFLTWRHGFVKRGLIGEIFSQVGYFTRNDLLTIEYLFLAVAFALTYVLFRRMLFGPAADVRLAVLLLSAPAVLPHIGFLFAQPDVTLYLLLLVCLYAFLNARAVTAAVVSLLLCCAALLAHEAFSLMFYPLVAAILLQLCRTRRLSWFIGVLHVAVVFCAFAAVLHFGTLKVSPDTVLAEATARTNAGVQRQVFDVMASTLQQQQGLVHTMYTTGVLHILVLTLVLSLPYFWLLTRLLREAMRTGGMPLYQQMLTGVLFLSPLSLCALGHDTTRWIGAMCLDASLFVLFLFLDDTQGGPVRVALRAWADGPTLVPWLAYVIAAGPYGATGLRSAETIYTALTGA